MEKKELFDRLNKMLYNIKEDYDLNSNHDAFIVWYAQYGLGLDPDECSERVVADKRAEGIDAVLVDQKNFILYFIQACTSDLFEHTKRNYGENDVKNTLTGLQFLLTGNYKGCITPELENLIDEYHDFDKTGDYKLTSFPNSVWERMVRFIGCWWRRGSILSRRDGASQHYATIKSFKYGFN